MQKHADSLRLAYTSPELRVYGDAATLTRNNPPTVASAKDSSGGGNDNRTH